MALKNWVRCFLKREGEPHKWVKVVKHTIGYHGESHVKFSIGKGILGKYFKRIPIKFTETIMVPRVDVYTYPFEGEKGILNPNALEFVCTNRVNCFTDLIRYFQEMETKYIDMVMAMHTIKQKFDTIMEEVKKLETNNPILVAHKELEKEFSKVGVS